MTMTPSFRKLALTAHITTSVGWFGAVAAFLSLAIIGLIGQDELTVRACYLGMGIAARFVIVPLAIASLVTGLIQALGSKWGLFRHYWIVVKLVIAALATMVLLLHMQPINFLSHAASKAPLSATDYRDLRFQLVVNASTALAILLVAIVLAVYKPRGVTRYGWRKQQEERQGSKASSAQTE